MAERGPYRAVKVVLLDGPDYQELPERARHLFLVLKMSFGPSGIEVHYPEALAFELQAKTGMSLEAVRDSLDHLERAGWIHRERNVVWIVGQLEHDPHMNWKDEKQRTSIWRHVAGLPRLPLVGAFIAAHPDWFEARTVQVERKGKAVEKELDAAPDDLKALLADAAVPPPPSEAPREGLRRASEGPSEALRSTEYRIPSTDDRRQNTTRAIALGAGAPPAGAPDEDDLPTVQELVKDVAPLVRRHLWLGNRPPPQVLELEPKWTEGREADIVRCWLRDGEVEDLETALAVVRLARHALDMEDRPFSLLFLHDAEGRGRFQEALGYARKELAKTAGARDRAGPKKLGDAKEAIRGTG